MNVFFGLLIGFLSQTNVNIVGYDCTYVYPYYRYIGIDEYNNMGRVEKEYIRNFCLEEVSGADR
ncbi:MAG: hypothetical protein OHK0017_00690 [Patescibacteria group bacterium]